MLCEFIPAWRNGAVEFFTLPEARALPPDLLQRGAVGPMPLLDRGGSFLLFIWLKLLPAISAERTLRGQHATQRRDFGWRRG